MSCDWLINRIVGEMPATWDILKSDYILFYQEGPGIRSYEYTNDGCPIINVRCVRDGIIDLTDSKSVSWDLIKKQWKHFLIDEGDILVTTSGTIGRVGIVKKKNLPLLMNTSVIRFKSLDNNKLTKEYLFHFLKSDYFYKQLSFHTDGGIIKNVGPSHIKKIKVALPPLVEQKKIAEILTAADKAIEKTDAIIKETQQLKKGLMTKILNKGVGNTDFKQTKLGGYIDVLTDYHANGSYEKLKENVELLKNEDYSIMIRTTNLVENNFSDLRYISKSAYNFLAKSKVSPGDIVMNKIADPGTVFLVPKLGKPLSLGMNLFLIRTNAKLTNQKFVFYYLKQNENYIKRFTSGSTTKTITKEAVRNLTIWVPPLNEQNKIVQTLSEIDSKLDNEKAYKSELEQLKKGLLQVLLTGKVRVKV